MCRKNPRGKAAFGWLNSFCDCQPEQPNMPPAANLCGHFGCPNAGPCGSGRGRILRMGVWGARSTEMRK